MIFNNYISINLTSNCSSVISFYKNTKCPKFIIKLFAIYEKFPNHKFFNKTRLECYKSNNFFMVDIEESICFWLTNLSYIS